MRALHSYRKFEAQFVPGSTCSVAAAVVGSAVVGGAVAASSASKAAKSQAAAAGKVSDASNYAADLSYDLGNKELEFNKQQYADNKVLADKIANKQLDIADQTAAQGQDYYDYMKSFRPVEQQMMSESMTDRSGEIGAYDAANKADASALTADDATVYGLNRGAIDARVGQAVADTQGGYTRSLNQAIRQGLRYGGSRSEIVNDVGNLGVSQASSIAAAANGARTEGIADARSRTATGLSLRQSNMGALNKERAIDWARKLDAAGLVKGLPGASTGAYGLAVTAGNSAVQNTMAPGIAATNGMNAGINTMVSGANAKTNAMMGLLNQPNYQAQAGMAIGGALMGGASAAGAAYAGRA